MECPKCKNTMSDINDSELSAKKCAGCNGIWFHSGSHEEAKGIEGASGIDNTETNSAKAYNEIRDFDCPECNQAMIKMVDKTQLHIEFEACHSCKGVFFDAGEFKDLTEFTFVERIKQTVETIKSNL